jgi:hypothetical protein
MRNQLKGIGDGNYRMEIDIYSVDLTWNRGKKKL